MRQLFIFIVTITFAFSCAKDKSSPKKTENITQDTILTPVKVEEENQDDIIEKEKSIVFTVQVAALHQPNDSYKGFNNADVYKEGNFTKYRIGHFATYKEAKLFRRKVLKTYPGAFIQALENDKPIHISKALQ